MPFARAYRLQYDNFEGRTISAIFYDRETWTEDVLIETAYTELQPSGRPIQISIVNNEEKKFGPIRAKQAIVSFLSDTRHNLTTFLDGADDRWYTEIFMEDDLAETYYFLKGHVVLDDIQQQFQDNSTNCEVTLTVTDGLGLIKDVNLVDFDGNYPRGKYPIIKFVAWALAPTGLELDIRVANNLMHENEPGDTWYRSIYLEAKTFEGSEIGEAMSCYQALETILGDDSYLAQVNGDWKIQRVDEIDHLPIVTHVFSSEGEFSSKDAGAQYNMSVGYDQDGDGIRFSDESAIVRGVRALKYIRELFNYEYPAEIIDNIDFSRGDINSTISVSGGTAYDVEDWTLKKGNPDAPSAIDSQAYIARVFEDGYEKERYVIMTPATSGTAFGSYLESNPIPVHQYDKFTASVDARFNIDFDPGALRIFMSIRLLGDDGTKWYLTLADGEPVWRATNFDWSNNTNFLLVSALDNDGTEWQTFSWESAPVPVDGQIYIQLHEMNQTVDTNDDRDIHYQNLQFTYIPHINGSYAKYSGHHNKITGPDQTKAKRDEEVKLGDSPRKLFKGALWKNGTWTSLGTPVTAFNGTDIRFSGDVSTELAPGTKFRISNSDSNNRIFTVVARSYNGVITTVTTVETSVAEATNTVTLEYLLPGTYTLAGNFYAGNLFGDNLPSAENLHPFGFHQAYSVWNQHNRTMRVFEATMRGLRTGDSYDPPEIIHNYELTDASPHTTNRRFILLHYNMDLYSCEWTGVFAEVYNTVLGKTYADTFEFKYISDNSE